MVSPGKSYLLSALTYDVFSGINSNCKSLGLLDWVCAWTKQRTIQIGKVKVVFLLPRPDNGTIPWLGSVNNMMAIKATPKNAMVIRMTHLYLSKDLLKESGRLLEDLEPLYSKAEARRL